MAKAWKEGYLYRQGLWFATLGLGAAVLYNLDFPLGFHADEAGKVRQILEGEHSFFHPLLLIQAARALMWLGSGDGAGDALYLGRGVSILAGMLLVPAVYLLARRGLPRAYSLAAAVLATWAPITVVHAQYLKEDVLLTLFVTLSTLALLHWRGRYREGRSPWLAAAGWGLLAGLMLSAKYVGVLFLAIQVLFLIYRQIYGQIYGARRGSRDEAQHAASSSEARGGFAGPLRGPLGLGLGIALVVFVLVNLPAFLDPQAATRGLLFEARHVTSGHGPFSFHALAFFGLFHLEYSLLPGMGLPLLACVLLGLVALALPHDWLGSAETPSPADGTWQRRPLDALLAISALALYLVAEASPTKPFPDAMRYLLPAVPMLVILAARGAYRIGSAARWTRWPLVGVGGLLAILTAGITVTVILPIRDDPRHFAPDLVAQYGEPTRWELFTHAAGAVADTDTVESVARLDLEAERQAGTRFLVASSFLYDWVFLACEHGGCEPEGEALARGYRELFRCHYREMEPDVAAFAFHHPTLRIVDLDTCPAEALAPEGAAEGGTADGGTVEGTAALRSLPYAQWVPLAPGEDRQGVTRWIPERTGTGVTLFTPRHETRALLVDLAGRTRHVWEAAEGALPDSGPWQHVELLPGGDLVLLVKDRFLARLDWDSKVVWTREGRFHHEIVRAPGEGGRDGSPGETLWVLDRHERVVSYHHDGASVEVPILADRAMEIDGATGEILRTVDLWPALRGLVEARLPEVAAWFESHGGREALGPLVPDTPPDLFHTNSVWELERDVPGLGRAGDLLLSVRHLDRLVLLDPAGGELRWTWGEEVGLDGQHHATILQNERILLFDNGRQRGWSRILEVDPATGAVPWSYRAEPREDFWSRTRGAVQRLVNGNTLVTESDFGRLFEVTPEGEVVWEYLAAINPLGEEMAATAIGRERDGAPVRAAIYRAARIEGELLDTITESLRRNRRDGKPRP